MWNADDFDLWLVTLIVICLMVGGALAVALPWVWSILIRPALLALVA